jgi:tetratricopeptide (TPR) repeat protein
LFRLGREAEAAEVVNQILAQREPADLRVAALLYQELERYDEAIPILGEMLSGSPDSLEARFWLAAALERTGRRQEAASEFLRLLENAPDFHPALNYLGYMWAERGENLEEALQLVQRAVKLSPDNGAYVDSLGWTHYQLGDYQEALRHLERAAVLSPREAVILEHLGDVYRAMGETPKALEIYRRALELSRGDGEQLRAKLEGLEAAVDSSGQR